MELGAFVDMKYFIYITRIFLKPVSAFPISRHSMPASEPSRIVNCSRLKVGGMDLVLSSTG